MNSKPHILRWAALITVLFLFTGCGRDDKAQAKAGQVWTCSMHPQVRLPKPGKCPICEMPLIPAKQEAPPAADTNAADHPAITLSEHARAMASVETVPVERRPLEAELRAVGKIQPNESTLAAVVSRVDGYVERLFVNFTGLEVKKGDHLAEIYSPDLVIAQQELLVASGAGVETTRLKLLRLGLTDDQVNVLLREKKITERVTLFSPIEGTVFEKMVVQNSPAKAGDILYRLANLESVWVYLDIYEYELQRVQYGRTVELATESYPGETFAGRVWFISPAVTEETRTVKVLVNIANRDRKLKPGMYVSATVRVPLLANGRPAPTGVEGQWTCPMHPAVLQPNPASVPAAACRLSKSAARHSPSANRIAGFSPCLSLLSWTPAFASSSMSNALRANTRQSRWCLVREQATSIRSSRDFKAASA